MKRLISLLVLACLCAAVTLRAQSLAKDFFVSMPDSPCPSLTTVNRADCIDFLESHMRAEVTNRLNGKSEMTALTPDYIRIRLTSVSTWQMKVLQTDTAQVICTVSTVCGPVCDSRIHFYTTRWGELPVGDFLHSLPTKDDFILPPADSTDIYLYQDLMRQADMTLLRADLSASEPTLTFTYTTPEYMEPEAGQKMAVYVRGPIVYDWSEGKFVRRESTVE